MIASHDVKAVRSLLAPRRGAARMTRLGGGHGESGGFSTGCVLSSLRLALGERSGLSEAEVEALVFALALVPADGGGVGEFGEAVVGEAVAEVVAEVAEAAEEDGLPPGGARGGGCGGAGGFGDGAGVAEGAAVGLLGGVVVAVHGDGVGDVANGVALGAAPAGVFVVLRVLEVFAEAAFFPDVAAEAAADHAEKVIPPGGLALGAEAAVVVAGEDGLAVGPRDLAAEAGGDLAVLKRVEQRAELVRALRGGIGVEEEAGLGAGEAHAVVHDAAGVVLLRGDLDEMGGVSGAEEILGAIGAAAVDDDEFPRGSVLSEQGGEGLAECPGLVVAAHDDADVRGGGVHGMTNDE